MSEPFSRLRSALEGDRRVLRDHLQRVAALTIGPGSEEPTCSHVALALHHTYTAVENILKRIAKLFEGCPEGPNWHRTLLTQMGEETDLRPRVLSEPVLAALSELLAFRHYLVHGSVVMPPEAERLGILKREVDEIAVRLGDDLDEFDRYLESLIIPPHRPS